MIVDAHQHFWKLSRGDYPWPNSSVAPIFKDFYPEDFEPLMQNAGVSGSILVQATATEAETRYLLEISEKHDWVLGVVGWVDLENEDCEAKVRDLAAHPYLVGIRPMLQDISDVSWVLRPKVIKSLEAFADCGLAMDALIQPRHLPAINVLLDEVPGLRMVIDHAAKPDFAKSPIIDPFWRDGMAKIAKRSDAYCKFSGLTTEAGSSWRIEEIQEFAHCLVKLFGTDRLMWGSDWPVVNLESSYAEWLSVSKQCFGDQSREETSRIFAQNTLKFYGIDL